MSISKKIVRNFLLPGLLAIKADNYYLNKSKKNFCIINFHGVRSNSTTPINNRHLSVDEFDKILSYLHKRYTIVTLSSLFDMYRKKIIPASKTIAITFDDGYKNNFDLALPVLKKYKVPATYYIITKSLTDELFLAWPELYELIRLEHKTDIEVNGLVFKKGVLFNEKQNLYLVDYFKTLGSATEKTVEQVISKYKIDKTAAIKQPELFKLVSAEQLRKYKNEELLEFGSHTHTHPCLEFLDETSVNEELQHSSRCIEEITGKKPKSLAFPDGSYTTETLALAIKNGFSDLVAVSYKYNENNTNPNLLSRFTISNSTTFESNVIRLAKEFDMFGF